jgi:hypothetical protein
VKDGFVYVGGFTIKLYSKSAKCDTINVTQISR